MVVVAVVGINLLQGDMPVGGSHRVAVAFRVGSAHPAIVFIDRAAVSVTGGADARQTMAFPSQVP